MTHFYSPDTHELIVTGVPSDWMGRTDLAPPSFDAATQSAFFVDGAWQVQTATPPITPIPVSVSMRQARLALLGAGLLASVNAAVAAIPGAQGDAARIEWEYAQEVRRDSALVQSLASALALDATALDSLFVTAGVL